jgi:hypothetical protein
MGRDYQAEQVVHDDVKTRPEGDEQHDRTQSGDGSTQLSPARNGSVGLIRLEVCSSRNHVVDSQLEAERLEELEEEGHD